MAHRRRPSGNTIANRRSKKNIFLFLKKNSNERFVFRGCMAVFVCLIFTSKVPLLGLSIN